MDTSTSPNGKEVALTTEQKIAILRGAQTVSKGEMTKEDWVALIEGLIEDLKRYFKYLHPPESLSDRVRNLLATSQSHGYGYQSYVPEGFRSSGVRLISLWEWRADRGYPFDRGGVLLTREGLLLLETISIGVDPNAAAGSSQFVLYTLEFKSVSDLLSHLSSTGAFSVTIAGPAILGGLCRAFDRSIEHKQDLIRNLELAKDQLRVILSHRLAQ